MYRTRVKLCEFETLDSAFEAAYLDVDDMGFHIFKHQNIQDKVSKFKEIFQYIPANINKVLLTDISSDDVNWVLRELNFESIQLYPDWDSEQIRILRESLNREIHVYKVMSAVLEENRFKDDKDFLDYYTEDCDFILLDSFRVGGTGQLGDQSLYQRIVNYAKIPVYIAGGLNALNVGQLVTDIKPYGVDVETGVSVRLENGPLVKNIDKCRAFIEAVRFADKSIRGAKPCLG